MSPSVIPSEQPQNSVQKNTKATATFAQPFLDTNRNTMAQKNALWNDTTLEPTSVIASTIPTSDKTVSVLSLNVVNLSVTAEKLHQELATDKEAFKECEKDSKTLQTTADDKEQLLEKQKQNVALATTEFEAAKRNLDIKSSVLETLRKLLSAANRAYKNAFNAAKLMQTRKRYAIEDEKQALIDNNVFLKAHREDGHTFIENMRDRFEYID